MTPAAGWRSCQSAASSTTSRWCTAARATRSGSTCSRRPSPGPTWCLRDAPLPGRPHAHPARLPRRRWPGRIAGPVRWLDARARRAALHPQPGSGRSAARRRPARLRDAARHGVRRRRVAAGRVPHRGRAGAHGTASTAAPAHRAPRPAAGRKDAAMIGGRRPTPGPQARRPAHPRRAAAGRVLPLHRAGHARRQAQGARGRRRRSARRRPRVRRVLFGRPLASEEEIGERLSKSKALAIFSSDAISSSAYATEEILRALLARRHRPRRAQPGPPTHRASPCCWRSSPSATARSCIAYPTAAARTPSPRRTSGGSRRSSRRRRCSSTTC